MRLYVALLAISVNLVWSAFSFAQDQPGTQDRSASRPSPKEVKRRQKELAKELGPQDKIWLEDEVADIITPEERRAFLELATNEEREQFRESFWDRRNQDSESPVNTAKEEHYRRLAYADEHFSSGIPGRKTDRGRIYIIWGPPDEIDAHPTGGTYERPLEQGGGPSSAYPWEAWRYRRLEGVGENIEIEFVDPTGSGEYHIALDPCEKDALAHVPGAGPSLSEMLGLASRAARFTNSSGTTCPTPLGGVRAANNEFDNLDRYFRVQRAPQHFPELEEKISARVVANQLPFQYRADFLRATSNTALVPITVQLRNRDLSFRGKAGLRSAVLDLYGRISDPGGRIVQTFEDVISRDFPESLFQPSLDLSSIYQKSVPLRSGLYRLDLVIKDTLNGNIGTLSAALRVPVFEEGRLDASSLILADQIEPVATTQIGTGQFVLGAYKVRPRLSREFSSSDTLGIFLQLYNLKVDEATHQTKASVAYRIVEAGTESRKEVWREVETADHLHQGGEQLTVERSIPVSSLAPGRYWLEMTAIDLLTNDTISRAAEFIVRSAPAKTLPPPRPFLF